MKLKQKLKNPFLESPIKFEDFIEENHLKKVLSTLFNPLILAELEQERRIVEIEIDEEENTIKFKAEKRKSKKRLEKKGNIYKIQKEVEKDILTLVYSLSEKVTPFETPEIKDRERMYIKLSSANAVEFDNVPIDYRILNPPTTQPQTQTIQYEEEPPKYENYEEKFNALDGGGLTVEHPHLREKSIQYPREVIEKQTQVQIQLPKRTRKQLIVYRILMMQNTRNGETVLDLLRKSGYKFTSSYDRKYGTLITSIDGIQSGYKGAHWEFYVNGKIATVGVSNYILKEGDIVTWKLMKGGCPSRMKNNRQGNIWYVR